MNRLSAEELHNLRVMADGDYSIRRELGDVHVQSLLDHVDALNAELAEASTQNPGTSAWAVEQMWKGKRVRCEGWPVRDLCYIATKSKCRTKDGAIIKIEDLDATDWEVVE